MSLIDVTPRCVYESRPEPQFTYGNVLDSL